MNIYQLKNIIETLAVNLEIKNNIHISITNSYLILIAYNNVIISKLISFITLNYPFVKVEKITENIRGDLQYFHITIQK